MSLPHFLIYEMRFAFQSCRSGALKQPCRHLSSSQHLLKRPRRKQSPHLPIQNQGQNCKDTRDSGASKDLQDGLETRENSTKLVPQEKEARLPEDGRKVPVPMKIIPRAEISAGVKMTPRERLHLEVLTRRQPRLPEKKAYRERLLIYHWGFARENWMAVLKMSAIVCWCAVTFIIAPAHIAAGTPLWLTSLIFVGGHVPAIVINYLTKPMVSRVFLNLPPTARESPKAAMEYARNLPKNAELDVRFLRPWALEGSIQAQMSEFAPIKSGLFRPLTFQWIGRFVNKGSILLPNPTKFFVAPKTASGRAARDTIPGLWANVYKHLSGVETDAVAKWKQ